MLLITAWFLVLLDLLSIALDLDLMLLPHLLDLLLDQLQPRRLDNLL